MFPISDQTRFILWLFITIATLVLGFLANEVGPTILFTARKLLTRRATVETKPDPLPTTTWLLFWILLPSVAFSTAVASAAPRLDDLPRYMSGDFRIAVAQYTLVGSRIDPRIAAEISQGIYQRIQDKVSATDLDFTIVVWDPTQVGPIRGDQPSERSDNAAALAQLIGADIVVYGVIEELETSLRITPEFYVAASNFAQTEELTGQHSLGAAFEIADYRDLLGRVAVNNKLSARTQALSHMLIGLAYYSLREYSTASTFFASAAQVEAWQPSEGQHVLYLFSANAALRRDDLDLAEEYYRRSLQLVPDYSRALLGLANIYYRRALLPIQASNNPQDLDQDLIFQALNTLAAAITSPNQPPKSDIEAKYHFELGQCYLMLAYAGHLPDYARAQAEFELVIAAYGQGQNLRLQERAAEAHARLGLIYSLTAQNDLAAQRYAAAASLTTDPERKALFLERQQKLDGPPSDLGGLQD